jgi:hypothetical protein
VAENDDAPVVDDVDVHRLLNPALDIDWDHDEGRWVVKSSAFQNPTKPEPTNRMSVVLGDTLEAMDRPPEDARRAKPEWYVAALTAGFVRTEDQEVERSPTDEEPAHGDVVGDKKSRARRRRFADAARWVVEPPPPV